MTYLLRLDCSPRNRDSVSRELADNAEKRILTLIPSLSTKTRDLATANLPHITNDTIAGFYAPPSGKTEKLKAATALSDELIRELKMADTLLISAPMYNFGVPSSLKAWIDQIVRINETFAFDGSQFEGLVTVKRSVLVLSYGAQGYAQGGDLSEMDFLEPYLRALMSFLGIEKTHVIRIEGTTGDPDALETAKRQNGKPWLIYPSSLLRSLNMLQSLNFSGRTALIMGASQGIGLATAKTLAAYGATVVLTARSHQKIESEVDSLRSGGLSALAVPCDGSDYLSVTEAIEYAVEKTGRIDILVNNAGVIEPLAPLIESDPDTWARAADINYKGVYHGIRAAAPIMLEQGGGTIINMSSGAANSALIGWSHYCSVKAAAKKLTEVAHKEIGDRNIRVVGLSPGTVATAMMEKIRESKINTVSNLDWSVHIPPEWVGEAVAFLCGDEGAEFAGTDFSLKTSEGRKRVGLPTLND